MDRHGRVIDYLRISITDRCNERCLYCMPEGYKGWARRADHLTAREIVQVATTAVRLGFTKIRLTGGEPTIRGDLMDIVRGVGRLPGLETLAISTNGTRLAELAGPLREAGVTSVNVSLDALDAGIYRRVTGGDVSTVMAGLKAARAAGILQVKLNTVLMRGVNEHELWPLIFFAAEHSLPLRFIELMPLSRTDVLTEQNFLSVEEVRRTLALRDELEPLQNAGLGCGPARYFRMRKTGAILGFIGAMTTPDFCATCNKIRLTADGKLRPCLGRHNEIDILASLREGADMAQLLEEAIALKPLDHEFRECYQPGRPMTAIGG